MTVERWADEPIYHIVSEVQYNLYEPLVVGSMIETSEQFNPFFAYYDTALRFPVMDGQNLVWSPAGTFLRKHVEGLLQSSNLPTLAARVERHYRTLCRELLTELVRREVAIDAPSRTTCLFVCNTEALARYWIGRLGTVVGGQSRRLLKLSATGKSIAVDARWLMGDTEQISKSLDNARRYWRGEATENPEWEYLFDGKATVVSELPISNP